MSQERIRMGSLSKSISVTPIEARSLVKIIDCTKNRTPSHVLIATMAYTACAAIFSTSANFCPVSNFTKLHVPILATHSYVLLLSRMCCC